MTDEATAPRRLRAQDVIEGYKEIIEQLTQRGTEPHVSVEFTRNAKGETQATTKVSASGDVNEASLELLTQKVYGQAHDLYVRATSAFPAGNGFARNEGQEPPK